MNKNRILELALETLEKQKAEIDAEIEKLRAELKGQSTGVSRKRKSQTKPKKKRSMTAAQRKAHSESMKKYWAQKKRRMGAAKN